jgi:hypothetical protein
MAAKKKAVKSKTKTLERKRGKRVKRGPKGKKGKRKGIQRIEVPREVL